MPLTCSARGCQAAAAWSLLWNNPKLHTPDRRKSWLACDEHRESLGDFLRARGSSATWSRLDAGLRATPSPRLGQNPHRRPVRD